MVPKHLVSTYDMIDHLTKFRASCVIKNKQKEIVVPKICLIWISIFCSPQKSLIDNKD